MVRYAQMAFILFLTVILPSCAISTPDSSDAIEVRYVKCIDGDTFTCEIPGGYPAPVMRIVNVRIRGIDAPELHDKRPDFKQRALDAKAYLEKRLVNAKRIELRRLGKDKYFRVRVPRARAGYAA